MAAGAFAACAPSQAAVRPELHPVWLLEEQAALAIVQRDTSTLRVLLDTSYVFSTSASVPLGRSAFLREVTAPTRRLTRVRLGWRRLRVYEDAAVVTGEVTVEGYRAQVPFILVLRYTSVYIHRHRRWQAVGSQVTIGEFNPDAD
jgi:hypothetical protein